MRKIETSLPGVFLIEPTVFQDQRGFFMETFHEERMRGLGVSHPFVQDNHSRSLRGTLRGLHYQVKHPQAKLCRVVSGEVLDVAVDIRQGSQTFGRWTSAILSEVNKRQIYIPVGFAHGFLTLSESADFLYKCSEFYSPEHDRGILWNDPVLAIDWKLSGDPLVSAKDAALPLLADVPKNDLLSV
jgi:dTDP-4-dehydrorhamnose 3,5-epimerase